MTKRCGNVKIEMVNRRTFAATLLGSGSFFAPYINTGRCRLSAESPADAATRVIDLVRRSTVIDMLGLLTLNWHKWERWCSDPRTFTAADLKRVKDSGITLFHLAVSLVGPHVCARTERWIADCTRFLDYHSEHFTCVRSMADLAQLKASGKTGFLLGMQDSVHFRQVADVPRFRALGQLTSQLTYNGRNRLGCGCFAPDDDGISSFGTSVIEEMNRSRMVVDVSHCGTRTTLEALDIAGRNALITHANCRGLNPRQPRCKSDEEIRRLAAAGGVMGITSIRSFARAEGTATINDVLDHFAYAVRLVGVEHVGIGSDADLDGGNRTLVAGLDGPDRIYQLAEGLVRRGFGDRDIELMLGGNFLRVLTSRALGPQIPDAPMLKGSPIDLSSASPVTS